MKILLSAYACEPNRGSEPGVGWNTVVQIAKYHEVWVFTSNTHRNAIEAELAVRPLLNLNFIYLDPLGWVYDWSVEGKRAHWDVHLHYYLWQIKAYFVSKALHHQVGFDIIHHVTYVKYSSPSFLSLLPVPFIWGPVGGAESAPSSFWKDFSLRGKIYENLRNLSRWLGECDPFVHLTTKKSAFALVTTEDTATALRRMGVKNVLIVIESGLSQEEIDQLAQLPTPETAPLRFISMGRLLHWKGFYLGLRAFALANLADAEYWILGEGPEQEHLKILAGNLGISNQVKFLGRLSRDEGLIKLGECHALVHPSLHDSGGWVCLEAMAAGRPVICLDLGGPGVQVTDEVGFKIPAHDPEQAVRGLADAMLHLAKDPEIRVHMGQMGRKRVGEFFSWQSKAKKLVELYQEALSRDLVPSNKN
jgi:glycosyltransferase involved in cell wall biosynthesis